MLRCFAPAKGFCRAKFWANFAFWRGAVFGEVWGDVSGEVFGLGLLGHSEQQKTSAKTLAQASHAFVQQNWRKLREKLHAKKSVKSSVRHYSTIIVRHPFSDPFFERRQKGGFVRVVLANVPSFRFSFRGNMRTYPRSGFFVPGQHPHVPSFRFSFRGNMRQNHPFENHRFVNTRLLLRRP